ncbi:NTP/NDP exchange transporter [Kangiella sp. HZ709]|uniref:NTP/NDP exchange transporter n=1 Tax=Kangiella sp. HZ709 TaxID=2666328 RepID=UPI0012B0F53D|nr:MFS transporter [Kangiella sp. HZ709]MRX27203.1 MFS transporter [Kangiella sp. HZ709]
MTKTITKKFTDLIDKATKVHSNELKATLTSFAIIFILMASYFVLRPVRDAMASDWSDSEVSFLWNLQFFISIGIVSIYGFVISKLRFKNVVPLVYSAFALSFLAFYFLTPVFTDPTLVEKSFYVWVSAFSLFHVSVFWSFMADTFNKEQSKRVFSVVAAGASLGAIVGPAIPTVFAEKLGLDNLMLIAAVGLLLVVPLVIYMYRLKSEDLHNENLTADLSEAKLKAQWWTGFKSIFTNKTLLAISAFILLYVFIGSFVYFEQKNLLADYSRADRTQILGGIDWITNTLTFLLAFFVTGRLTTKLGMAATLALVPFIIMAGMIILAFAPIIVVLLALQVTRRAGNYAVTRPAREMLFTDVSADERFKSKPVIDIVVYRGGDAVSGSIFALLSEGLGLGLAAISLVGAGIAATWGGLAVYLGKKYDGVATFITATKKEA